MENTKSIWKSKTIWGLIITLIGFIGTEFFKAPTVPVDADLSQLISIAEQVKTAPNKVQSILSHAFSFFGLILAFVGRIKAETKIS
jgi:hypothetical protein